jgi:transcriptional regulator with XRE-family HTH domain
MQTEPTDPEEIVAIIARVPRWVVEGIEQEAATLSERAGGVHISRNAALVVLLKRGLSDKRKKPPRQHKAEETRTLRIYRAMHEGGRITNTRAAEVCGCSEATIRRWLRGETQLPHEKEQQLATFLEGFQAELFAENTGRHARPGDIHTTQPPGATQK